MALPAGEGGGAEAQAEGTNLLPTAHRMFARAYLESRVGFLSILHNRRGIRGGLVGWLDVRGLEWTGLEGEADVSTGRCSRRCVYGITADWVCSRFEMAGRNSFGLPPRCRFT